MATHVAGMLYWLIILPRECLWFCRDRASSHTVRLIMQTSAGGYRVLRLSVNQCVANYHDLVYAVVRMWSHRLTHYIS